MLKQCLICLAATILVLCFGHAIHIALGWLLSCYNYFNTLITPIFNQAGLGKMIHQAILLTTIPLALVGLPQIGYKLIKGQSFPYFMELTWCIWLVLVLTILVH